MTIDDSVPVEYNPPQRRGPRRARRQSTPSRVLAQGVLVEVLATTLVFVPMLVVDPIGTMRWLGIAIYVNLILAFFYAAVGGVAFTAAWIVYRVARRRGWQLHWAVASATFLVVSGAVALLLPLLTIPMSPTALFCLVPPVIGSIWIAWRWRSLSGHDGANVQRHGVEFRFNV